MSHTPEHVREAQRAHVGVGVESVMTDNGRDFASKWITGPGQNIKFNTLAVELGEAKAELRRFRSERSYVVGVNDGYEAAEEHFSKENLEFAGEIIELREQNSQLYEAVEEAIVKIRGLAGTDERDVEFLKKALGQPQDIEHAEVIGLPQRAETVAELRTALYMPRPDDFVDLAFEQEELRERARIVWQNRQTRWDVAYATLSAWERFKYALNGAEWIGLPVRDL